MSASAELIGRGASEYALIVKTRRSATPTQVCELHSVQTSSMASIRFSNFLGFCREVKSLGKPVAAPEI